MRRVMARRATTPTMSAAVAASATRPSAPRLATTTALTPRPSGSATSGRSAPRLRRGRRDAGVRPDAGSVSTASLRLAPGAPRGGPRVRLLRQEGLGAALHPRRVDPPAPVALGGEDHPAPVRRPGRELAVAGAAGDARQARPIEPDGVEVIARAVVTHEGDARPVGREPGVGGVAGRAGDAPQAAPVRAHQVKLQRVRGLLRRVE